MILICFIKPHQSPFEPPPDTVTNIELQLMAVVLYVAYRTTLHLLHHKPTTGEYRNHFLNQMLHEAVRDDPRLRRVALGIPAGRGVKRRAAGA